VNHWLFQYWQFATGKFIPRNNRKFGKSIFLGDKQIDDYINANKLKVLCINDRTNIENYDDSKKKLIDAFEKRFPKKSSFEK
jgi:hypothetical protein